MRMEIFTLSAVDQQPFSMKLFNESLKGSSHVETYTMPNPSCGDMKTIVVFAFYPDTEKPSPNTSPEPL